MTTDDVLPGMADEANALLAAYSAEEAMTRGGGFAVDTPAGRRVFGGPGWTPGRVVEALKQGAEVLAELMAASLPRIRKTPDVCGGDACVGESRITVAGLEEYRRLGWSDARLLDEFPALTPEGLRAAWEYVEMNRKEIERAIATNREDN